MSERETKNAIEQKELARRLAIAEQAQREAEIQGKARAAEVDALKREIAASESRSLEIARYARQHAVSPRVAEYEIAERERAASGHRESDALRMSPQEYREHKERAHGLGSSG